MDWNSPLGSVVALASGLLILSAMVWGGQVILNLLGDEAPANALALPEGQIGVEQHIPGGSPVKSGHERLATQLERDDTNRISETPRPAVAGRSSLS